MTTLATLWLIDDDAALRLVLADTFTEANLTVISFTQAQAAWTRLNEVLQKRAPASQLPDVILTDIRMPMMDGLSFSDWVHKHFPELPIVIMTAHSDLTSAINSYQAGAFDYLAKPFDLDDAVAIIYKALNYQPSGDTHQESLIENNTAINEEPIESNPTQNTNSQQDNKTPSQAKTKPPSKPSVTTNPSGIIGQSQAMQTVFRAIGRLAHSPITVLITGESGTGKELVASALHQHSPRANHPFIALNMAAIPHDLIESELFGHEKGAFTGATTQRQGRFEQADGGTLFLDEIGDMPFSTQTRLLRVLANGEFYRVGGQQPVKVDVRIIAATHQNLEQLVQQGKFREDLFYRLNVIRLPLPPLRARREDIPALARHFMQQAAEQMNTAVKQLSPDALRIMQAFDWRGNVRQLENVCLWLTVMAAGDMVLTHDLPPELLAQKAPDPAFSDNSQATFAPQENQYAQPLDNSSPIHSHTSTAFAEPSLSWQQALADWAKQSLQAGETDILQAATPEFERVLLKAALNHSGGRKVAAAQLLGWGRNTLTRKLTLLDISKPDPATKD
ncbi:sigma 54-interacting transcriptional regulator [Psychrobacter sp. 1U2]|uniref:sigma 54-interacting transcriptional regulator n=1 Tax=Psychrobacter sp. 1U2 TaxID=3453577 RepID=UPI003F459C58